MEGEAQGEPRQPIAAAHAVYTISLAPKWKVKISRTRDDRIKVVFGGEEENSKETEKDDKQLAGAICDRFTEFRKGRQDAVASFCCRPQVQAWSAMRFTYL